MFERFQSVPKKNRLEQSAGAFCKQGSIKSPFPPRLHPLVLRAMAALLELKRRRLKWAFNRFQPQICCCATPSRFPAQLLGGDFKSKWAPVASLLPVIIEVDADAGASSLILELSLIRVLLNPAGAVGFAGRAGLGCMFPWQGGMLVRGGGDHAAPQHCPLSLFLC